MCRTLETFCMHLNIYKNRERGKTKNAAAKTDSNTLTHRDKQTHNQVVGSENFYPPERLTGTDRINGKRGEDTNPNSCPSVIKHPEQSTN